MQEIENIAIETYANNLEYLSKNYQPIFNKVQTLSDLIEAGSYIEKYALDYKENYFDIKELRSDNYLYIDNSIEISKKLAKQVNMQKK